MGILNVTGKRAEVFKTIDDVIAGYDNGMTYGLQENPLAAVRYDIQGSRKDGFLLTHPVIVIGDPVGNINYKQMIDPSKSNKLLDAMAESFGWVSEGRYCQEQRWSSNMAHYDLYNQGLTGKKLRAKIEVYVDNRAQIPDPANAANMITNPEYGKTNIIYRLYERSSGDDIAKDFDKIFGALRKVKGLFAQRPAIQLGGGQQAQNAQQQAPQIQQPPQPQRTP
jgi:hypothetical protein